MDALASHCTGSKKAGTVVLMDLPAYLKMLTLQRNVRITQGSSQVEFSVVGGGHTAAVIEKLGIEQDFTHISTGGGACIEFLTGKNPGCRCT